MHNPKLAKVIGPLGAYFRTGYSLSEREREIAVCIINSKWHSIYPTNAHERAGKAAGLPADMVEALLSGQSASCSDKRASSPGVDDPGFLRRAGRSDRHGARACELDEILDVAVLFPCHRYQSSCVAPRLAGPPSAVAG